MTRRVSPEPLFFSPLTPDWTIADLLDWIAADDARCHDERLAGILDAVCLALDPGAVVVTGRVVGLVRQVAMQVSAQPGWGERMVGEAVGASLTGAMISADLAMV